MIDLTAWTRREFLGSSVAMLSTAATIPTFLGRSSAALAAQMDGAAVGGKPGVPDERILVVVQLSGGNDGLNTVVPFGAGEYYNARPGIAVPESQVIRVDQIKGVGLHPELRSIADMIGEGTASVIQGVGYPNPNRSHFASMDIWHTGDTLGGRGHGWIGRALDAEHDRRMAAGKPTDPTACVCIGSEAPLAGQGRKVKPISFQNANLFRWVGADLHPSLARTYDTTNRAGASVAPGIDPDSEAAFVLRTALDAQLASDRIRAAVAQATLTSFPAGALADQLRMVSSMIRAGLPTRVYYVGLGGFDTHASQPYRHGSLLRQFSTAVRAFYQELKAMGQDQRVLTMAFSEFGRRVTQNASGGTDHGTAGPMFLFGPAVRPGLLGEHPSLTRLDSGDLIHKVDFRNIYAAILDDWMKVPSTGVLGKGFRPAAVLRG